MSRRILGNNCIWDLHHSQSFLFILCCYNLAKKIIEKIICLFKLDDIIIFKNNM